MSPERQIPDHFLSPRLARSTTDSAVGQPLIGATWVGKYPRVCQWHVETRWWLTHEDRGHPGRGCNPPPTLPFTYTHIHRHTFHVPPLLPPALSACPLETTPCSWYEVSGHYSCQQRCVCLCVAEMLVIRSCLSDFHFFYSTLSRFTWGFISSISKSLLDFIFLFLTWNMSV